MTIDDLHEPGINSLRKSIARFDQRPLDSNGGRIYARNDLYRVRIAHGEREYCSLLVCDLQLVCEGTTRSLERNSCRFEFRNPHIHGDCTIGADTRNDDPGCGFHANFKLLGQSLVVHEPRKAARPVSAVLHFPTVGVEDSIKEIGVLAPRLLDDQDLITTDAETAIGNFAQGVLIEIESSMRRIDHDKVVPKTVHFGELNVEFLK